MFKKDNKGFTIIEVLIVLAIAGLILLIVFLAVPALQRNSRNTARNNEASRISALVTECMANRNGVTASCQTAGNIGFDANDFQQVTGVSYSSGTGSTTVVNWQYNQKCAPDGSRYWASTDGGIAPTARQFAVTYQLESGNGSTIDRCIGSE